MCNLTGAMIRPVLFVSLSLLLVVGRGAAQVTERPTAPVAEIVLNDTKMVAEVGRSAADVDRRVRTALDQMGLQIIQVLETATGTRRQYRAHSGDRIVEIGVEAGAARSTTVRVSSMRLFQGRSNGLNHDTDHARRVLDRILRLN